MWQNVGKCRQVSICASRFFKFLFVRKKEIASRHIGSFLSSCKIMEFSFCRILDHSPGNFRFAFECKKPPKIHRLRLKNPAFYTKSRKNRLYVSTRRRTSYFFYFMRKNGIWEWTFKKVKWILKNLLYD